MAKRDARPPVRAAVIAKAAKAERVAAALKGNEQAREDLRRKQSRLNRSPETQAAWDMLFDD